MKLRKLVSILSILAVLVTLAAVLPAAPAAAAVAAITMNPTNGPVGTAVTVTSDAVLTVGSTYSILFDSVTVATGIVPAGGALPATAVFSVPVVAWGNHTVTVTTTGGDTSNTLNFAVTPSLTPTVNTGPVGTAVSVTGNGFTGLAAVTISWDTGTISTLTTSAAGSFLVNFNVPQAAAGAHTVYALDSASHSQQFTFIVTPLLTVSPASLNVGSQLSITGSGFAASAVISLFVNGSQVTTVTSSTVGAFSYNYTVPASVHGTYALSVSDTAGDVATATYTVNAAATISPTSFTAGSAITVSGTGFAGGSAIAAIIDGEVVNSSVTTTDASGSFRVTSFAVPKVPGGSHTLQFMDASGNAITVNFNVTTAVTVLPTTGATGTSVQVTGTGFTATTAISIFFDGVRVTTVPDSPETDASGDFIASFAVPAASGGNHQVVASDGNLSATGVFAVTASANISVVSGTVGTTVTVTGASFASNGTITVTFDSVAVATATANAAGSFTLNFAVPQSAAGNRAVVVGDGTRSVTFAFAVQPSVAVTPAAGNVGSDVTVRGTGFSANSQITVKYDSQQVATAASNAVGTFTAVFSAPASKGGDHTITVADNTHSLTSTFAMDSTPPPVPILALPLNGTKADALAQFQWTQVSDPSGVTYDLQVSRDENFGVLIVDETGLTTPGYTLTVAQKLSPASRSKPYYWRVRAVDGASNASAWSAAQTFFVGFVLPSWAVYAIFGVVVVLAFVLGWWLGGRRRPPAPKVTSQGNP